MSVRLVYWIFYSYLIRSIYILVTVIIWGWGNFNFILSSNVVLWILHTHIQFARWNLRRKMLQVSALLLPNQIYCDGNFLECNFKDFPQTFTYVVSFYFWNVFTVINRRFFETDSLLPSDLWINVIKCAIWYDFIEVVKF